MGLKKNLLGIILAGALSLGLTSKVKSDELKFREDFENVQVWPINYPNMNVTISPYYHGNIAVQPSYSETKSVKMSVGDYFGFNMTGAGMTSVQRIEWGCKVMFPSQFSPSTALNLGDINNVGLEDPNNYFRGLSCSFKNEIFGGGNVIVIYSESGSRTLMNWTPNIWYGLDRSTDLKTGLEEIRVTDMSNGVSSNLSGFCQALSGYNGPNNSYRAGVTFYVGSLEDLVYVDDLYVNATNVPEPSTFALMAGIAAGAYLIKRRNRR
jgi:hypothetical protein